MYMYDFCMYKYVHVYCTMYIGCLCLCVCACRVLADANQDGRLSAVEFCLAMHMIQRCLQGAPVPTTLPAPLLTVLKLANNPQLPVADDNHVKKCRKAFGAFHLQTGVLGGECVCVSLCVNV